MSLMLTLRLNLPVTLAAVLLAACASTPPTPDWQDNAAGAVKSFTSAYLAGNSPVAEVEFARARREIGATGRLELMARAELVRCAARVASLELDNCAATQIIAPDLAESERAYAAYLSSGVRFLGSGASSSTSGTTSPGSAGAPGNTLDASQIALLPEQHRPVVSARDDSARIAALSAMADPLARLVAAGVLFSQGQLPPAGVAIAVNTASDQGWRRALLAWLGVQLKLAEAAADSAGQARIQRRIDLALGGNLLKP